jgi:hypothetical protein
MKRLCIIGCVKTKHRGFHAAKDLYTSALFKKRRAYAETGAFDSWMIVSGLYGILHPDSIIEYYQHTPAPHFDIGHTAHFMDSFEHIEVHAGKPYVEAIRRYREDATWPLKGYSIGLQLGWYKRRATTITSLTQCTVTNAQLSLISTTSAQTGAANLAWGRLAPKMAAIMHSHSGYPNQETAENVVWLSLLMSMGRIEFMNHQEQIDGGTKIIGRYFKAANILGLLEFQHELYAIKDIEWTPDLLAKAYAGYAAMNRLFSGPTSEH